MRPRLRRGPDAEPGPPPADGAAGRPPADGIAGPPPADGAGPRPTRLRSRTAWTVFGQSSYIVSQFLLLVLLARLAGVEEVGRFGYATPVITPVYWLTDLGLRTNKTTDVANLHSFSDLLALRVVTPVLGYGLILAVAAALTDDEAALAIAAVFGAAKGVEAVSDLAYGVFQRHGRMALFARSMIVRGFGGLAAFGAARALGSVATAFAGPLVVWAAACLAHDLGHARRLSSGEERRVRWRRLWPIAVASLPLGGAQFLAALNTALPRLFIERIAGIEALGIFTALSYVLQAANMTMTAVSRSIAGHLADLFRADRPAAVRRTVARYALATLLAGPLGPRGGVALGRADPGPAVRPRAPRADAGADADRGDGRPAGGGHRPADGSDRAAAVRDAGSGAGRRPRPGRRGEPLRRVPGGDRGARGRRLRPARRAVAHLRTCHE